jgi:hypothetical protein
MATATPHNDNAPPRIGLGRDRIYLDINHIELHRVDHVDLFDRDRT